MNVNWAMWSQEDKDKALNLWMTTTMSQREIADHMGVGLGAVVGIKFRNNWPMKKKIAGGGFAIIPTTRTKPKNYKKKTPYMVEYMREYRKKKRAENAALKEELRIKKEEERKQSIQQAYENSIPKLVHMFDIRDGQCRQIIGEPKSLTMCGNNCHKGSYCIHHYNANIVKTTYNASIVRSFVEKRA